MKNFLITALAIIATFGAPAYAQTSTEEYNANNLRLSAIKEQKATDAACATAIKETESYNDSVTLQLAGLEEITFGLEKFESPEKKWEETSKHFQTAIKNFQEAHDLCLESHHLQLSRENYDSALTENIAMRIGGGLRNSNESKLSQMFRGDLLRTINRILGALAIMYIVLIGAKYVLAMGDQEKMSSYKSQFAWLILGLAVISLAEFVGFDLLDPSGGNDILSAETEGKFMEKVRDVVRYFEFAAGGFMLINAILAGYHLIMSGEKEET